MAIYALGDQVPDIHPDAYVSEHAVVIGSVLIAHGASIWPGAVLRGDYGRIEVGAETSVQDNAVVHVSTDGVTSIGPRCTIGHLAHLEGCAVGEGALVGVGAVLLAGCHVGPWSLVAAGAVVLARMHAPPGSRLTGIPATIRDGGFSEQHPPTNWHHYVDNGARYRAALRRIG